jgi:hypothetical protein
MAHRRLSSPAEPTSATFEAFRQEDAERGAR